MALEVSLITRDPAATMPANQSICMSVCVCRGTLDTGFLLENSTHPGLPAADCGTDLRCLCLHVIILIPCWMQTRGPEETLATGGASKGTTLRP